MNAIRTSKPLFFFSTLSTLRRAAAVSALGLGLLGAAGCAVSAEPAQSVASADRAAHAEHAGMPGAILRTSIEELNLRPDQKVALEAIRATLKTQAAPVREAKVKLGAALAGEVRVGKVDRAALDPLVAELTSAAATTTPAMQKALNDLHATLDATQRKELVASVRAKFEHMRSHGERRGHMQKLAKELALTDAQIAAIKSKVRGEMMSKRAEYRGEWSKMKEMKVKMEAIAAAFESDSFDAKALDVGAQGAMWGKRGADMIETMALAVVPVLTPEQRAKVADKILEHTQAEDTE